MSLVVCIEIGSSTFIPKRTQDKLIFTSMFDVHHKFVKQIKELGRLL